MASEPGAEIVRVQAATAGISLMKALIDYSACGPLADAVTATQRWLIREGISETSFNACRDLAANCAHPNRHGLELQRGIDEADNKIRNRFRTGTLQLIVSGSLGRLVGRLPELAWMVTTVATLLTVHPPRFVTDALCSMILDQGGHEDNVQTKYEIRRTLIRSTIAKVTESIFLNVTNVGYKLNELPPELSGLHSHLLEHLTFAAIVMSINRNDGDTIIKSCALLLDLTLWLMYHFEGMLEIYVQTELRFKKQQGDHKRRLRLMIENSCRPDSRGGCADNGHVEVSNWSGTSWKTSVKGKDSVRIYPVSYQRRKLYQVEQDRGPLLRPSSNFTLQHQNAALHTARVVFQWLFSLPLTDERPIPPLSFRISRKGMVAARSVGDLFSRHPWLAQQSTHAPRFSDPIVDWDKVRAHNVTNSDRPTSIMPTAAADLDWLPIVADLLNSARLECSCRPCTQNRELDACLSGCVRYNTFNHFILLLIHGLCDAMGANDVSGDIDTKTLVYNMVSFLHTLVTRFIIDWNELFLIVGSAISGKSAADLLHREAGASACAAMQYGSLVACASWLDISADLTHVRPFTLDILEGNIQGLSADYGIVFCEAANNQGAVAHAGEENVPPDTVIPISAEQKDQSEVEVYAATFSTGPQLYRLMTCIAGKSRFATVDPSRAIAGHWRSKKRKCQHRGAKLSTGRLAPCTLKVYDFEAAFGSWDRVPGLPSASMTTKLDTHLKLNTLLSFEEVAANICIEEDCCLDCILDSIPTTPSNHERIITFARRSGAEVIRSY